MRQPEPRPALLGDVLYGSKRRTLISENTWAGLVQSIAARDQLALHALYARMEGIVFTWITQVVRDPESTAELMLDVFHDVWRNASTYKPSDRSIVGWIMSQARSRAVNRVGEQQISSPPSFDTIVAPQTDVLRPVSSLWLPLARRIASETGQEPLVPLSAGRTEPEWDEVAPGIFCKLLATDRAQHRVSMLVRLSAGVAYPPHTHAGLEELYLLHGELMIEDRTLYPGAYNRGEPGDSDQFVWSGTGCMCVLLTSTRDVLHKKPPTDLKVLQQFRAFLGSLPNQPYCLDCVSRMYEQPANAVWTCLRENGILGRYAQCSNCGRPQHTFRHLDTPES